jgi:CelD/BcsL family acetyltransferase involved in cellulose biosynthesis
MRAPSTSSAAVAAAERIAADAAEAAVAVEELRDRGAICALRDEWRRLAAEQAAAGATRGPYLAPEWLAIWAASLANPHAPARVGELRLLVAHRAGRLLAVLPLVRERRRLAGVPATVLRSLTDDHSQRFDLLLAPGADGDEAAVAAGFGAGAWPAMRSPYLALPSSAAGLDELLDAKFRGNLRRRARKLEAAHGPLTLERIDGARASRAPDAPRATPLAAATRPAAADVDDSATRPAAASVDAAARAAAARADAAATRAAEARPDAGEPLDAALAEGFALEAAGWKGARGTAIACDPALTARYRAVAHAFAARGQLCCYFLRAGARRVAFHFALCDGDTYYLFKPGFDPELASFGLGHLLVDAVARDLIARGVRELDFLGDDMPWKREWTAATRDHAFEYLFAPTLRGRALAAWKLRVAPALKRAAARLRR